MVFIVTVSNTLQKHLKPKNWNKCFQMCRFVHKVEGRSFSPGFAQIRVDLMYRKPFCYLNWVNNICEWILSTALKIKFLIIQWKKLIKNSNISKKNSNISKGTFVLYSLKTDLEDNFLLFKSLSISVDPRLCLLDAWSADAVRWQLSSVMWLLLIPVEEGEDGPGFEPKTVLQRSCCTCGCPHCAWYWMSGCAVGCLDKPQERPWLVPHSSCGKTEVLTMQNMVNLKPAGHPDCIQIPSVVEL